MTDPTAEDWVVSAAVLQMPGERSGERKLDGRIVLDEPTDDDGAAEDPQGEELPAIETFVPPAPDIFIPAPPTPPDASVNLVSTRDQLGTERDLVPRTESSDVGPAHDAVRTRRSPAERCGAYGRIALGSRTA